MVIVTLITICLLTGTVSLTTMVMVQYYGNDSNVLTNITVGDVDNISIGNVTNISLSLLA